MSRRLVGFSPDLSEQGGAAAVCRLITSELARRGFDVKVVAPAAPNSGWKVTRSENLTVLETPGFGSRRLGTPVFLATAVAAGCWWALRAEVLFAIQLVSPSLAAWMCSAALRVPFVSIATTSGPNSEAAYLVDPLLAPRGPWSPAAYRVDSWIRRQALRRAASLVVQTEAAACELGQAVGRGDVVVIPNPVRHLDPRPLNGSPRASFAGRFSRDKNLAPLLEAWSRVVEEYQDAHLTLIGAGGAHESTEAELRSMVEADPMARRSVTFSGWVADIAPVVAASDVFVFPSLTEAFSIALLEACALGRVVVASDIPPNRAVLGDDYPLLFPPTDTGALSSAILRAFGDEAVRDQARKLVLARVGQYTVDRVVDQLEQVFLEAERVRFTRGTRGAARASRPFRRRCRTCRQQE